MRTMVNLLIRSGRLQEAYRSTDLLDDLASRAQLDRWTQLTGPIRRLHIRNRMGDADWVMEQVPALLRQMEDLSEDQARQVAPWAVREQVLEAGAAAARSLEQWDAMLRFGEEAVASATRRGAVPVEVARVRLETFYPRLRLGDLDGARRLVMECHAEFERAGDTAALPESWTALALVSFEAGDAEHAVAYAEQSLRAAYASTDVGDTMAGHYYLEVPGATRQIRRGGAPSRGRGSHRLRHRVGVARSHRLVS